jgi:nucleoid-associated protein YgaU
MAPFVNVDALKKLNHCDNVKKCSTCEPVFRHTKEELGKMLGYTAIHEIGHVFGLLDKSSFTGANDSGHSGDPKNYMFAVNLYPGYLRRFEDYKTTMKYTIKKGDNLSKIAARIGLSWKKLYEFKGQDGKKNRELLRSGDPNLIYPGEGVWIPDDKARLLFKRKLWLMDESFTKSQIDSMRRWIVAGRTMYDPR